MIPLDHYEERLLAGKEGRLKQVCLENILRYAEILGADQLCEVTKATVFCGAHNYLNVKPTDKPDVLFFRMNLAVDEIIPFDRTYGNCYLGAVRGCELSEAPSAVHHPGDFQQLRDVSSGGLHPGGPQRGRSTSSASAVPITISIRSSGWQTT
jgi:hypothetical protein